MKTKPTPQDNQDFNRRDFIRGSSLATIMAMLGGVELRAQAPDAAKAEEKEIGDAVKCGVIGLGARGREIVSTLVRLKQAEISAVCDKYPVFMRRGANLAPKAKAHEDYRKVLDDKEITAVLIATPHASAQGHRQRSAPGGQTCLLRSTAGAHAGRCARDCAGSPRGYETDFPFRIANAFRPAAPLFAAVHPFGRARQRRHGSRAVAQKAELADPGVNP
jgi:hypothetical protein